MLNCIQNDSIQESSAERSSLYRKCRLEEIKLPLIRGHLRNVPMDDSNLRDQTAMDVDRAEDGSQSIQNAEDYGIEVDFDILDEEEQEVGAQVYFNKLNFTIYLGIPS
jgi:structural maintenance of chromosome 1